MVDDPSGDSEQLPADGAAHGETLLGVACVMLDPSVEVVGEHGAGQPSGVGGEISGGEVSEAACFEVPDGGFHLGVFAAAVRRLQAETGCCCWLRRDGTASRLQLSLGAGGAGAADGQPQRRPPRRVEDGLSGVGLPAVWAAVGVQSFSGMALAAALAWAWSGIVTGRPAARRSSVSIRA